MKNSTKFRFSRFRTGN
ncbi:hypothetical protein ACLK1T_12065 [Escherichia coli]